MKLLFLFAVPLVFIACAGQKKIIIPPETQPQHAVGPETNRERWELLESQNGPGGALIPEWVNDFLEGGIYQIEADGLYQDKYVFIGENRGGKISPLLQWADGYSVAQDLPRLVTRRVEERLVAAASLYPDDEYGEYFEALIKKISNAEYSGAVKEERFWIKRRIFSAVEDAENDEARETAEERYEFFVLISIEKTALRAVIHALMASVKTTVSPTRDQAAAINRIQQTFFEGF